MKIRGPAGPPPAGSPNEDSDIETKSLEQGPQGPGTTELSGRAAQIRKSFNKCDLKDKGLREEILRLAAEGLIEEHDALGEQLSSAQKEKIIDVLTTDPGVRKKLEEYLNSVLV